MVLIFHTVLFPMMLKKKVVFQIVVESILATFCFVIFVFFFFYDQIHAYIKGSYTLTNSFVKAETLEFPTVTLCTSPGQKTSPGLLYGLTHSMDLYEKDIPNVSLTERFDNLSYSLDRDFQIMINGQEVKVGINTFEAHSKYEEMNGGQFEIKLLRTYTQGTCYSIIPNFEIRGDYGVDFKVTFNSTLVLQDLPDGIMIYLTSNMSWANIPDLTWPRITPTSRWLGFGKSFFEFYVNIIEYIFKTGVDNVERCLTKAAMGLKCPVKCHLLGSYDLPSCNKTEELNCMYSYIHTTEESNCYLSKKFLAYKMVDVNTRRFHNTSDGSIEFYIGMWSMIKEVKEEIEVLSTPDLIGSVGGSLGMFFGFSFTATCNFFLRKVFKF